MKDKENVEIIKLIKDYCTKEVTEKVLHILINNTINEEIQKKTE